MAFTLAFTACQKEDLNKNDGLLNCELKEMTFTAVQEGQDEDTKTTIDGINIKWESGDKISIFDGGTADADGHFDREFILTDGEGTKNGTFSGLAADDAATYYAVSPALPKTISRIPTENEAKIAAGKDGDPYFDFYSWNWSINAGYESSVIEEMTNDGISAEKQAIVLAYLKNKNIDMPNIVQLDGDILDRVIIPSEQIATAGSADPQAMCMMAKSTDASTLHFKNVCAYVKVKPQFDCIAICLRSKGSENLTGTLKVDYNNGEPTTTVIANGSNEVYLVGTITKDNDYYIAVRPETLSSGFIIEFLSDTDKLYYARSSNNDLGLARSNVTDLGEFTTSGTWDTTTNGLPTSGDDGNGHNWQLVSSTLKLAKDSPIGTLRETWTDVLKSGWDTSLWAIPQKTDVQSLASASACSYNSGTSKAKLGIGVLKYATEEISICNGMWLLDHANTSDHLMLQFDQHSIWAKGSMSDDSWGILYKYIGG